MFEDLLTCLRLARCDLLIIVHSYTTAGLEALRRKHLGKEKVEILTSGAVNNPAKAPGYFTMTVSAKLFSLLKAYPSGFSSSRLYREIYNVSPETKPQFFDLSGENHTNVWLCHPVPSRKPPEAETDGGLFLNLKLRLTGQQIESSALNDIALHLQSLPHVEEIKFGNLFAPSEEIEILCSISYEHRSFDLL